MKHKAEIRFAADVWKQIEWFTYNFPTEIGALGKMKAKKDPDTGEKYFYVSELLFPKQYVTGAEVHFTAAMWGDLLKEHGLDGLKDVSFYWHRHPGNSAHSGTDDVDTFETFMSVEANRKHFAFLQTAVDSSGVWNEEARIDIRLPIRHTILSSDIQLTVDKSSEEIELENRCNAISKNCIVEPTPIKKCSTGLPNYHKDKAINYTKNAIIPHCFKDYNPNVDLRGYADLDLAIANDVFGQSDGSNNFNNDFMSGYGTSIDEKVSLKFENGQVTIIAGSMYGDRIVEQLRKEGGLFAHTTRSFRVNAGNLAGLKVINMQPRKKMYPEMKKLVIRSYLMFCDELLKAVEKVEADEDKINNAINETIFDSMTGKETTITGKADVTSALLSLDEFCLVDWESNIMATVYDFDKNMVIGNVFTTTNRDKLYIKGDTILNIISDGACVNNVIAIDTDAHEEEQ